MMGLGFIRMLLFWGGLIALAVWLIGVLFPASSEEVGGDTVASSLAQDILRARYAHGELTTEEYHERLNTIQREHTL